MPDTDMSKKQPALKIEEQDKDFYKSLVDLTTDWIWEIDSNDRYTFSNATVSRILGYEPSEIIGKTPFDFMPVSEARRIRTIYLQYKEARKPFAGIENTIITKDGRHVVLETNGIPVINERGELIGYRGIDRDITDRKKTAVSLAESQRVLSTLMSNLPGMVYRCRNDEHWTMDFVSDGCGTLTGYDKDELIDNAYTSYANILYPEDRQYVWEGVQEGLQHHQPYTLMYRIVTRKGEEKWVWEQGQGIYDEAGNLLHLEGFITDIDQQKQAEEKLRELNTVLIKQEEQLARSEEQYRTLVQAIPDIIVRIDSAGRYTWCNNAGRDFFGQDVIGHSCYDYVINEPERRHISDTLLKLVRGGNTTAVFESSLKGKDGIIKQFHWHCSSFAESGEITGILSIGHDITNRKLIEEELRSSQQRYYNLFNNAAVGILRITLGDGGRILESNQKAAEILGYADKHDIIDNFRYELHYIRLSDRDDLYRSLEAKGDLENYQLRMKRKDGASRWLNLSAKLCPEDNYVEMILVDITEQKKYEEQTRLLNEDLEERVRQRTEELERVNKELEAFSYSVSHDLRAPLRSLNGLTTMLNEDYAEVMDDTGKDMLNRIKAASLRMGSLIDDMLLLSRINRQDLVREKVNMSAVAVSLAEELQRQNPERRAVFTIEPDIEVLGDAKLLAILMENLIGNAWKFTAKNQVTEITFGRIEREGRPVMCVRDNGVGFNMAYADKLFQPFSRLHSREQFEGTGIGLATVHRIIDRHGGDVWAEGEEGKGATFYFLV